MNAAAYRGRPAIETLGPLTLSTRERIDGPWLAILDRGPASDPAIAENIVLCGDDRAPKMWRRLDADQPVLCEPFDGKARPIALSEFGVRVTLYPHSRVLSVWRASISRARCNGQIWAWDGPKCGARIKLPRNLIDLVSIAAKDCNTMARGLA